MEKVHWLLISVMCRVHLTAAHIPLIDSVRKPHLDPRTAGNTVSVSQGHGTLHIVAATVLCSPTLMTPVLLKPSIFPTPLILRFVLNLPHSHAQVTTTPHSCKHTQTLTLVFSPRHYSNSLCLAPTFVLYLYSDLYLDFPRGQRELCGRPLDHSYTSWAFPWGLEAKHDDLGSSFQSNSTCRSSLGCGNPKAEIIWWSDSKEIQGY